jgi:hypothetical protein
MKYNVVRLVLIVAGLYAARRYYRNWGATKEECSTRLPGDELVGASVVQTTEAVTIDAPASSVWRWLVQMGQDRGGFYNFQPLEDLIGLRCRNADRLHPEWQRLDVGDVVRFAPGGWVGLRNGVALRVVDVVFEERIVLRAAPSELPWEAVWSFHIVPHWEDRCRLIIRRRAGMRYPGEVLAAELAGPFMALLTRGTLTGLKRRAETERERELSAAPKEDA